MFNFGKEPEQRSFDLVPVGNYEVFIERAEERPTSKGRLQLSIMLRIRDDIQQACQNRILFLNIFQKTPEKLTDADRQVGNYNYSHLYHLLDVTGILTSGKEFEDMNDICRLLIGKEIRVTVHHEVWNGKTSEKIDQLRGVHESEPDIPVSGGQPLTPAYGAPSASQAKTAQPPAYAPPAPSVPPVSSGSDDFKPLDDDDDFPF